jgi:hypothetical protein
MMEKYTTKRHRGRTNQYAPWSILIALQEGYGTGKLHESDASTVVQIHLERSIR